MSRIDHWLWAVRAFKTRTQAAAAIRAGHVTIDSQTVKPAREIKPGDILEVQAGERRRKLRCIASPKTRIGAGLLPQFAEDLIPPELQFPDQKAQERETPAFRPKGAGRPTKRERREIDRLSF